MSRITFQKRQKEMKRQEKKLAKREGVTDEVAVDDNSIVSPSDNESESQG
jgi:hypothetical protein